MIYKYLPNDTDLTLFINAGFISYNFAFNGNVAHYHTPLDLRANLSAATLQMHGDSLLGMASGRMQADFGTLKGDDDVYVSVFGQLLLMGVNENWILFNGRSLMPSYEIGVRYNIGTSIAKD